ncbi:MAG TPA: hypothetical protein VF746_13490 [Longimicrobium sp.]|jgi:hypothetical protein
MEKTCPRGDQVVGAATPERRPLTVTDVYRLLANALEGLALAAGAATLGADPQCIRPHADRAASLILFGTTQPPGDPDAAPSKPWCDCAGGYLCGHAPERPCRCACHAAADSGSPTPLQAVGGPQPEPTGEEYRLAISDALAEIEEAGGELSASEETTRRRIRRAIRILRGTDNWRLPGCEGDDEAEETEEVRHG